jgi:ABC-type proline/glycine betaine transport system ATPase subunit
VTHDIDEALVLADRIIVMRPWPGRIKDEITVDLPKTRDRTSSSFESAKRQLLLSLNESLQDSLCVARSKALAQDALAHHTSRSEQHHLHFDTSTCLLQVSRSRRAGLSKRRW